MTDSNSRLVYSTDGGRTPERESRPRRPPRAAAAGAPDDGIVRIHRAKSGGGGKLMTAITGLPGAEADLDRLLQRIKSSLGTGGTREGRTLLVQGDQRERLLAMLRQLGLKAKLAGG
jgi:translation initiation factor 1